MNQKITDLIYRIDNLVPRDVCQSLINFYEENEKLTSPEDSYKVKENKKSFDNYKCLNISQLKNTNKNFEEPFKIISQYLSIMLTNYVLHIQKEICPTFSSMFINQTDNIRILKYNEGAYIGDHSDVGPSIRASCTLNLNEDYEGGEFRFFDGRVKHEFKTGDAMLFPAEPIWIHGTEPVTKGTRYAINCFLKNDNIR